MDKKQLLATIRTYSPYNSWTDQGDHYREPRTSGEDNPSLVLNEAGIYDHRAGKQVEHIFDIAKRLGINNNGQMVEAPIVIPTIPKKDNKELIAGYVYHKLVNGNEIAKKYLATRGLTIPENILAKIGFRTKINQDSFEIIHPIINDKKEIVKFNRIFIDKVTFKKIEKKQFGRYPDCAFSWFGNATSTKVYIFEGLEDALTYATKNKDAKDFLFIVTYGASNIAKIHPLLSKMQANSKREFYCILDNDTNAVSISNALKLNAKVEITMVLPTLLNQDKYYDANGSLQDGKFDEWLNSLVILTEDDAKKKLLESVQNDLKEIGTGGDIGTEIGLGLKSESDPLKSAQSNKTLVSRSEFAGIDFGDEFVDMTKQEIVKKEKVKEKINKGLLTKQDLKKPSFAMKIISNIINNKNSKDRGLPCVIYFNQQWYFYDGKYWRQVREEFIDATIRKELLKTSMLDVKSSEVVEIKKALKDYLIKILPHNFDINVYLPNYIKGLDRDKELESLKINNFMRVSNGLLAINEQASERKDLIKVIANTPNWFSLSSGEYDYEEGKDCPRWLEFLSNIYEGDQEQIDTLQLWFGYLLSSACHLERSLCLVGKSRSGKGTILSVMINMLGLDVTTATTMGKLGEKHGTYPFIGKRLIYIEDLHQGKENEQAVETLKNIISNASIVVEGKNKDVMNVKLNSKFALATNNIPRFYDPEGGFINRIVLLHHKKSWAGKEDMLLKDKLHEELSGILNWAIEGLWKLIESGYKLNSPSSTNNYKEALRDSGDNDHTFIDDCVDITTDENNIIPVSLLFKVYQCWCEYQGLGKFAKSRSRFIADIVKQRMSLKEPTTKRVKGHAMRVYNYVKLKNSSTSEVITTLLAIIVRKDYGYNNLDSTDTAMKSFIEDHLKDEVVDVDFGNEEVIF